MQSLVDLDQQVLDEERNVLGPLAKRRQAERHHLEPLVEVLAKPAGAHLLGEIAVGGREDAGADRDASHPAHPLDLALLQDAQQLGLQVLRQLADLVEEDAAFLGELELARLRLHRPGEGAFLVAEQLGFEQRVDDGRAVDADEGLLRGGIAVDDAGDQLLAGAALPLDQHGGARGRDAAHVLEQLLHRRRGADDVVHLERAAALHREVIGPLRQPAHLQGPIERDVEGLDVDRLVDVVERARLHGEDGARHVVVGGDHQYRRFRRPLLQLGDEIDAGCVGQAHVEDDRRRRRLGRQTEPFGARGG